MGTNGVHESTEEPPNVPMITGTIPKCARRESMHDVVVDAAKAMAQVFMGSMSRYSSQATQSSVTTSAATSLTISLAHLAGVRMKLYEQLRYLH